jgi:hypothetical protein
VNNFKIKSVCATSDGYDAFDCVYCRLCLSPTSTMLLLKLDAPVLKANDIVLLEFVVRRYFPDCKVRSAWGVTFDLMRMFRMLSAPDDAPVEPNSGDKRSAIVIDDD